MENAAYEYSSMYKWVNINLSVSMKLRPISNAINGLKQISSPPDNIIFSGINPHAGEEGMLGDEENIIHESIKVCRFKLSTVTRILVIKFFKF